MAEPDVRLALEQPWVSIDNDASGTSPEGILGQEHPHPRAYATFPRILRMYVRGEHLLTLPDAIRKFTALAAQREHLADRGVIKSGMWADLVAFDPDSISDVATYEKPNHVGGDALGGGERRAGDRGRKDDRGAAGEGAVWSGVRKETAVRGAPAYDWVNQRV